MKFNVILVLVLVVVIAIAFARATSRDDAKPGASVPIASSLQLVSLDPSHEVPLVVGQQVEFTVEADYTLAARTGHIGIVVQDANGEKLGETIYNAGQGEHRQILQVQITVPDTAMVHVIIPLSARGARTTAAAELRSYEVVREDELEQAD